MRAFIRILGWCLLVIGIMATAINVAYVVMGAPGRFGFLVFCVVIVFLALWMARLPNCAAAVKHSPSSTARRSLSDQDELGNESNTSKEPKKHTAGKALRIAQCPHCATHVVPMADGTCPSCRTRSFSEQGSYSLATESHTVCTSDQADDTSAAIGPLGDERSMQPLCFLDDIDAASENPNILEDTRKRFGTIWRKQGVRGLWHAALWFTLGIVAMIIVVLLTVYVDPPAMKIHWFLTTVVILTCLLFVLGAAFHFLRVTTALLFARVPRAPCTPEQTMRQYYEPIMQQLETYGMKIDVVPWLKAYVCLTDRVKSEFGGYDEFVAQAENASRAVFSQLLDHVAPSRITSMTYKLNNPDWFRVERLAVGENTAACRVVVRIDMQQGIFNPPFDVPKPVGSTRLVEIVRLAKVGRRWYLADPRRSHTVTDLRLAND